MSGQETQRHSRSQLKYEPSSGLFWTSHTLSHTHSFIAISMRFNHVFLVINMCLSFVYVVILSLKWIFIYRMLDLITVLFLPKYDNISLGFGNYISHES